MAENTKKSLRDLLVVPEDSVDEDIEIKNESDEECAQVIGEQYSHGDSEFVDMSVYTVAEDGELNLMYSYDIGSVEFSEESNSSTTSEQFERKLKEQIIKSEPNSGSPNARHKRRKLQLDSDSDWSEEAENTSFKKKKCVAKSPKTIRAKTPIDVRVRSPTFLGIPCSTNSATKNNAIKNSAKRSGAATTNKNKAAGNTKRSKIDPNIKYKSPSAPRDNINNRQSTKKKDRKPSTPKSGQNDSTPRKSSTPTVDGASSPNSRSLSPAPKVEFKTPTKKENFQKASTKQKIKFSPSAGIIEVTEPNFILDPLEEVDAHVELQGFTPSSSTTSRMMPGSGASAAPNDRAYEIGDSLVDFERDLAEEYADGNNGSDVEVDDEPSVDTSVRPRDVNEYCLKELDEAAVAALEALDAAADGALRDVAGNTDDLLNFEWRGNLDNFEGVREDFVGPSGPTFDTTGLTPLGVFKKIWDPDIIAQIVTETNRYAAILIKKARNKPGSRINRWVDTTEDEIWRFLGIIMLQSLVVNSVEREYWYPKYKELQIGVYGDLMPYNRFVLLKRCLHFVDNASLPVKPPKLSKVQPILDHLNQKFSSLYLPEQNIAIDESLLKWKGRLSFAQLIASKNAKVGIKSYELCESRTGYLWHFEIYTGKGPVHEAIEGAAAQEPESATSQIVFSLMRPLFNRGHTLVMDNFYNAPLVSRILKKNHKTDTMGTLRLNREFVPGALKGKSKQNMRPGEVCFSTTKDLSVLVWMDKNVVPVISTFHGPEVGGKEKYGYYKYKPKIVLDYNLSMGGIDHKDQMLHSYPIERVRNSVWYKKLFRRLLNVTIHNAFVLFTHNKRPQIQHRGFRMQLAHEVVQMYCRPQLQLHSRNVPAPAPARATTEMHLPQKNIKKQRCKLCYEAEVKRTTMWRCGTCQVNLCMPGCYTAYHYRR